MEEILGNPVSWVVVLSILGALGGAIWWASSVHSKVDSLSELVKEIRDDIKKIFVRLPPPATVSSTSPLALTEFGKVISIELEAKKWATEIAPALSAKVKGKEEFEIHDFCSNFVNDTFAQDSERDIQIRKTAYNHGIDRDRVLDVLVIELRDSLLAIERA